MNRLKYAIAFALCTVGAWVLMAQVPTVVYNQAIDQYYIQFDGGSIDGELILDGGRIYDVRGPLNLGKAGTSNYATTASEDVLFGGRVEFDANVYNQGSFTQYGTLNALQRIYNSADVLDLGSYCDDNHGIGTGGICTGGALEVDGTTYLDGALIVDGGAATFDDHVYLAPYKKLGLTGHTGDDYIVANSPSAISFFVNGTRHVTLSAGTSVAEFNDLNIEADNTTTGASANGGQLVSVGNYWTGSADQETRARFQLFSAAAPNLRLYISDDGATPSPVEACRWVNGFQDMRGNRVTDTVGVLQLGGGGSSSHGLGANDVLIVNDLEVNTNSYFDGQVWLDNNVYLYSDRKLQIGTNGADKDSSLETDSSYDQVVFSLGEAGGRQLVLTEWLNRDKDHDHPVATNPELYGHSATDPDTANTEYWYLTHDTNNAIFGTGKGLIVLDPAAAGVQLPIVEDAAPSEPVACDGFQRGTMLYVDETDDSGAAYLCVCLATGDNGAGSPNAWDWRRVDDHTTSCPDI